MSAIVSYHNDDNHRILVRDGASIEIVFHKKFMLIAGTKIDDLTMVHIGPEDYPTPEGYHEIEIRRIVKDECESST